MDHFAPVMDKNVESAKKHITIRNLAKKFDIVKYRRGGE